MAMGNDEFQSTVIKYLGRIAATQAFTQANTEMLMLTHQDILDAIDAESDEVAKLEAMATKINENLTEVSGELAAALAANDQARMQAALDKLNAVRQHVQNTVTNLSGGGGNDTMAGAGAGAGQNTASGAGGNDTP
jgi:ATPase subunit of ABC transporter with duplicated ATPase domains